MKDLIAIRICQAIFCILCSASGFAQKTSTVQPKANHTSTLQTDPAGKEKEYMSIEEYELKYNRGSLMVFPSADQPAEFPGGIDSLTLFIKKNIKYPETAKFEKRGGKCEVKFVVQTNGSISDAKVERGIPNCMECDNEALRVILSMPNWKPATSGGKAVNVYHTLPILFEP